MNDAISGAVAWLRLPLASTVDEVKRLNVRKAYLAHPVTITARNSWNTFSMFLSIVFTLLAASSMKAARVGAFVLTAMSLFAAFFMRQNIAAAIFLATMVFVILVYAEPALMFPIVIIQLLVFSYLMAVSAKMKALERDTYQLRSKLKKALAETRGAAGEDDEEKTQKEKEAV
jgi:signal transduction histidine kinase